jgi:hypothetical protein
VSGGLTRPKGTIRWRYLTNQINGSDQWIRIASIDPREATRIGNVLKRNNIESIIEGSVAYGVTVLEKDSERAVEVLKSYCNKRKNKFWILFSDDD